MSKRLRSVKRLTTGFTLVELLTVVAIISVLVSILMPGISKIRAQSRTLQCVTNMRTMATGIMTFAANNEGRAPGGAHHNTGSGSSIAWQQILNAEAFAGKSAIPRLFGDVTGGANTTKAVFLCPDAISKHKDRRPLTMNGALLAGNNSPMGIDLQPSMKQSAYNYLKVNLDQYRLGAKLSAIRNPSTKIYIVESEAPRDTGGGNDLIAIGTDPAYADVSAGNPTQTNGPQGAYTFRHYGKTLNAVFCDGHVETIPFSPTAMHTRHWDLKK
jgi:prepilin-type N-terminal cleavage/methylation domain-containing protein/prepilin-type processing-associated H-X9-DG protein